MIKYLCPALEWENSWMLFGEWGHAMIASIRGGIPMINKVLTIVAFAGFCLELFFLSSIPSRLLGVS